MRSPRLPRPLARLQVLAALLAVLLACSSDPTQPRCADGLALVGVTIIDGLGTPPRSDQTLVVCDGRIAAVGPVATTTIPRRAKQVALEGRFVIPGFVDTHAHVTVLGGAPGPNGQPRVDLEASTATLRTLLAFGVTSVGNPAAPAEEGVALREAVAKGDILGPRIRTAGEALGLKPSPIGPVVGVADADAVRAEVRRQAGIGVDQLKLYSTLPPDLVRMAVETAHEIDLEVVGHLQRTTWTEGALLGVDRLTHAAPWSVGYLAPGDRDGYRGSLPDRLTWLERIDLDGSAIAEMVAALVEHEVSLDPTLIASRVKFFGDDPRHNAHPELGLAPQVVRESWQRATFTRDWSAADYARGRAAWPTLQALTRLLFESGVPLTAGTDLPNPWVIPGVSFHEEIQLLADCGIPALEVLRIATYNGAAALGLDHEVGSIETGKQADLVVLAADPLRRLANSRAIELVLLAGRPLNPSALLATSGS